MQDKQLTKTERLLTYMQMFKPLTRRIKICVVEAFQLPLPVTSTFQKLMCQSNKPNVQSRVNGLYPDEEHACEFPDRVPACAWSVSCASMRFQSRSCTDVLCNRNVDKRYAKNIMTKRV